MMKIDYELAEKIGATHYRSGGNYYKFSNEELLRYYSSSREWKPSVLSSALIDDEVKPISPQPESDYVRGMRKAMQAIAKSCGKVFGADIGYDDLPALVESLVNPPKPKTLVRVEYEKVSKDTISLEDLMRELLDGVHFYNGEHCGGHYPIQTVLRKYIERSDSLYRRIENPVDWRDEVIKFIDSEFDGWGSEDFAIALKKSGYESSRDKFLEMCRVALRANGELQ